MIDNDSRDDVVPVFVAHMPAQCQRWAGRAASGLEHIGVQLVREEGGGQALVDEDAFRKLPRITQLPLTRIAPRACLHLDVGLVPSRYRRGNQYQCGTAAMSVCVRFPQEEISIESPRYSFYLYQSQPVRALFLELVV